MLGWLSRFFLLLADDFGHSLPLLFQLLPSLQIVLPHLLEILLKEDFAFLSVLSLFPLPENLEDPLLEKVGIGIPDIDQLECILDSDFGATSEIIHQKLDEVKEISRFEASLIKDAAFIHERELVLIDLAIEVLVDLPDPLVHFGFAVGEVEFSQNADDVLFVDGESEQGNAYGFLLQMDSLSLLLFSFTLSPHIRKKVLRSRSASMFSIGISQTCYYRDFSWVFFCVEERAVRLLCFKREAMIVIFLKLQQPRSQREEQTSRLPANNQKRRNKEMFKDCISYNNKMNSFQNSSLNEPRIQDSILFEVNEQTLVDMNLTEHICRLEQMSRFLGDAINKNRANLYDLREVVKNQISSLKNSSQALQTNVRDETTQLKNIFEPAISGQIKKINELKVEVGKINSEQLSTKKYVLNLEAAISHCQTEIGFRH